MRPTVAIALHDGFYGACTEAGYAHRSLLRTLTRVLAPGVRLVVLPVYRGEDSPGYQAAWHQETLDICERAGVAVRPVANGAAGQACSGDAPAGQKLPPSITWVLLDEILPCADPVAVIFSDVSFLDGAWLLPAQTLARLVVVPRSTGLMHEPADLARIQFERARLYHLTDHGGWIAAISGYMREHLVTDYGLPADALIDLPDCLTDSTMRRFLSRIEPSLPLSPRGR
jgi:hypothetical protein